jgi:phosphoribosylformylglycinamidine cyclo-ligase
MAHITGGGLAANTARSIPVGLEAVLDRATWELPSIFATLSQIATLPPAEMEKTWNVGVGMVAVVDPASLTESLAVLNGLGITSWAAGSVRRNREVRASLINNYRRH